MSTFESTALSPRPEQPSASATFRRRHGASPLIRAAVDGQLSPIPTGPGASLNDVTLQLPEGRSLLGGSTIQLVQACSPERTEPGGATPRQIYYGLPPTPRPRAQFSEITETNEQAGPSIVISSPSFRSVPLSLQPSRTASLSVEKNLPRLPTPDFSETSKRSITQALVAPLNFIRSASDVDVPRNATQAPGFLRRLTTRQWYSGRQQVQCLTPKMERAGSDSSGTTDEGQDYLDASVGGGRLFSEGDPASDDRTYLNGSGKRYRRRTMLSTLLNPTLPRPQHRYPTLTSPNPNAPDVNSLTALLPALQEISLRFTQKFPWAAQSDAHGTSFVHLADRAAVTAMGVSLTDDSGFGVEGVGRWNRHKWALMMTVIDVFLMGLITLLWTLHTWAGAWSHAQVVSVIEFNVLVFATLAGGTLLITSLLGISGTLLNSRPILSFYCFLLWPSFISSLIVGYTAYRRRTLNLDGKISQGWNQIWSEHDRAVLQNTFVCCGFLSPAHDFSLSSLCYPRSSLQGCRTPITTWEQSFLGLVYIIVFSSAPLQILNIFVSLICSNHINRTFGKGLTPKAYRLSLADVKANAMQVMATVSATRIPEAPDLDRAREGRKVKEMSLRGLGMDQEDDYAERSSLAYLRTPRLSAYGY